VTLVGEPAHPDRLAAHHDRHAEGAGVEGLIVDADETVWMTPGFRVRFGAVP
jgi:hypothetical protein